MNKQTASNVDAFTEEEQQQVQEMIDRFHEYLQSAEFVAVAKGNDTCVAAYNIQEEVDMQAMYENFTGQAYPNVTSVEMFDLTEDDLNLTFVVSKYDGFDYSNFTAEASANATSQSGCCTEFKCTSVTLKETDEGADVVYSGTVEYTVGNTTYSSSFNISTNEYRQQGDSYTVSIDLEGKYKYKEWTDIVDSEANCSGVSRPANMSSLDNLTITHCDLFMKTQDDGSTVITLVESYFDSVSFSGGYGFYLFSDHGKAVIRPENHTCYNAFEGNWTSGDYNYSATFLNKDTDYYSVDARLMDRGNLTMREIQNELVNYLYLDPNLIFPEYEAKESAVGNILWATSIVDPFVRVSFDGEAKLKVGGQGQLSSVESQIEVRVSRVEGTVTGLTSIYQVEENVVLEDDPAFERTEQHVLVASAAVDFTEYPYMQPDQAANYTYVDAGYWYEVTILLTENCTNSDFCTLVKSALEDDTDSIVLRGSEESDSAYLTAELGTIELKSGLKFKEDALVYDFSSGEIFIVGASTIRGDSHEVLRFIGNITDEDTKSYFKVVTEKLWYSAFDVEELTVSSLTIKGYLTRDLEIADTSSRGQVLLGNDCEAKDCPSGEIQVWLNSSSYLNNRFQARFEDFTAMMFFNSFSGYNFTSEEEVPFQLTTLDASDGFTLDFAYAGNTVTDLQGFHISGNVSYYGVPSTMDGSMDSLSSDQLALSFEMTDFNVGLGNVKVKDPSANLTTDSSKYSTNEAIVGTVSFASLYNTTELPVTKEGLTCRLKGKVYGGLYEANVLLTSDNDTDIESATFTGEIVISESELEDLEESVRSNLADWIETGLKALNQSRGWVKEAFEPVRELEPSLCVENVACGTRKECGESSYTVCRQYEVMSECVEDGAACKDAVLECSESETICSVEKTDCEGDDCCESSVTVCHEWAETCADKTNDNCSYYELTYNTEACARKELGCGYHDVTDQSCLKKCQRTQHLYERAIDNYNAEQSGYNVSQVDLQGFRSIQDVISRDFEASNLIEVPFMQIIKVTAKKALNETGLGPRDWTYEFVGRVLDLSTETLEVLTVEVQWDLFDNDKNQRNLLQAAKSAIIDRSQGELNSDLETVSAFELIEGNRVSAKVA